MISKLICGLTRDSVDIDALTSGVYPLLLAGCTASENDPCVCVVESASCAPAVVVDQEPSVSKPNTSELGPTTADCTSPSAPSSCPVVAQPSASATVPITDK